MYENTKGKFVNDKETAHIGLGVETEENKKKIMKKKFISSIKILSRNSCGKMDTRISGEVFFMELEIEKLICERSFSPHSNLSSCTEELKVRNGISPR